MISGAAAVCQRDDGPALEERAALLEFVRERGAAEADELAEYDFFEDRWIERAPLPDIGS